MSNSNNLYLGNFLRHVRGSLFWSSLLTLLFFVIYMPVLSVDQYWLSLKICVAYSGSVFLYLTLVYGITYFWLSLQKKKYHIEQTISYPVHFIISSIAATLGVVQGTYLKAYLANYKPRYEEIVFSSLTGCFIALMFIFRGLYTEAKNKNTELKNANTEAELHALKNQMQPHFLFNSLNSLLSLIETNSKEAPLVTQRLSDLYREILTNSSKNVTTLKSEIDIIEKYLSMEKIRFDDRLNYRINTPAQNETIFIPPLVLQTLVENAIKHGVSKSIKNGSIEVDVIEKNGGFEATIKNTGTLDSQSVKSGTGVKNTKARLELLYGEKTSFILKQEGNAVLAHFWFSGEMLS